MPSVGFETATRAIKRLQNSALREHGHRERLDIKLPRNITKNFQIFLHKVYILKTENIIKFLPIPLCYITTTEEIRSLS